MDHPNLSNEVLQRGSLQPHYLSARVQRKRKQMDREYVAACLMVIAALMLGGYVVYLMFR